MKVRELIQRASRLQPRAIDDCDVVIEISQPNAIGGTPCVDIRYAGQGIDWDGGKFIIHPSTILYKDKNNVDKKLKMLSRAQEWIHTYHDERAKGNRTPAAHIIKCIEEEWALIKGDGN